MAVIVEIVAFVDDAQPGWVECRLVDADGRRWAFREKVPIVSEAALDAGSVYPQPGFIACEVIARDDHRVTIDTARPWGVAATTGDTRFEVAPAQLVAIS